MRATGVNADMDHYKDKITGMLRECNCFRYLGSLRQNSVFCSPFTVSASDLPVDIQLEVIDLQCDSDLKDKFASMGLDKF